MGVISQECCSPYFVYVCLGVSICEHLSMHIPYNVTHTWHVHMEANVDAGYLP